MYKKTILENVLRYHQTSTIYKSKKHILIRGLSNEKIRFEIFAHTVKNLQQNAQ